MNQGDGDPQETLRVASKDLKEIRQLRQSLTGVDSLILYSNDGVRLTPLLEGQSLTIGRFEPADVTVRDSSLSRQHACVEVQQGQVWVEDLESTNGTWVDGQRIKRVQVAPGTQIVFGAVVAMVHRLRPEDKQAAEHLSHDDFMANLQKEVVRAHHFRRNLTLIMVKSTSQEPIASRFAAIQHNIRPFDAIALYSVGTIEILLPETDTKQATDLIPKLAADHKGLVCGIGAYPDHATSANELLDVTRMALKQADAKEPVKIAARMSPATPKEAVENAGPITTSQAMQKVYQTVDKVASSVIPILILGETGTGKEVVARAIHQRGQRAKQPFVCINCGAIAAQLVESTLFGHERGAFTGAGQQSKGVFESADGGTVFLDEIGELPPPAQAALLRVLESKRFSRVGSTAEIEVDVRTIAATHQNLEDMCEEKLFREDLLYRLNAMTLQIPPLRERPDDVAPLTLLFLEQANQTNQRQIQSLDPDVLELLRRYAWPGNVRELRNAIERAVVIASNEIITTEDFPEKMQQPQTSNTIPTPSESADKTNSDTNLDDEINLKAELERHEADLILSMLNKANWNRQEAAKRMGISLRTLAYKMKSYRIRTAYHKDSQD